MFVSTHHLNFSAGVYSHLLLSSPFFHICMCTSIMSSQEPRKKAQKRKSTAGDGPSEVSVALGEASTSAGPAFGSFPFRFPLLAAHVIPSVNFPSIRPAKTVPFTLYSRDVASTSDLTKQQTLIAGETEDVEFFSTNRDRQTGGEGGDCQYVASRHPTLPLSD